MNFKLIGAGLIALASATTATATNIVVNGSFETTDLATKGNFLDQVAGWSGGDKLTFLAYPGTASTAYLDVYPGLAATSPDGGNFVEMDGDPNYADAIYQTIGGLTVGKVYTLNFYQAAGQQNHFTGPTTEQWSVTFGTDTQFSHKFELAEGATGDWEKQTMHFTATATSQVLSFLAVGTPSGQPPISFLDGVSMAVPEPGTWALMIAGFGLVGIAARNRRKTATA